MVSLFLNVAIIIEHMEEMMQITKCQVGQNSGAMRTVISTKIYHMIASNNFLLGEERRVFVFLVI